MDHRLRVRLVASVTAVLLGVGVAPAAATWSIVAHDPRTGDHGAAVASCVPDGVGFLFVPSPRGTVIAQARYSDRGRDRAASLVRAGLRADAIIARLADPARDRLVAERQYGVVLRSGEARTFTGSAAMPWAGGRSARGVAVAGNILTGPRVVTRSMAVYRASSGMPMHRRLLAALRAGERAGGDARCGARRATSAALYAVSEGRVWWASAATPDRNAIPVMAGRLAPRRSG